MAFGNQWRRNVVRCLQIALGVLAVVGCEQRQEPQAGSETHFLTRCESTCPNGDDCICGACTRSCTSSEECSTLQPGASCMSMAPRIAVGRCSGTEQVAICDLACLVDADCAAMGKNFGCQSGFCRTGNSPVVVTDDAGLSNACNPPVGTSNGVLVLGDSLIELTAFTAGLEQHAIDSGMMAAGDHFRQSASALMSFIAEGPFSIGAQYSTVRQEGTARIVIMDGGETDMFDPLCDTEPAYSCPTVQAAVTGAQKLLWQMAQDGVEQVVYFFYPDPIGDPALKSNLDVLRPLIENACGQSPVACHWVDLRTPFLDHAEYFVQDGKMFSDAGASAAGDAVWQRLQERCIVP